MSFAALFNEKAQDIAQEELDKANTLSVSGRALENGLRETGNAPTESRADAQKKKDREYSRTLTMLQLLEQAANTIKAMQKTIQDTLAEARQDLEDTQKQLSYVRLLKQTKDELENGAVLERDPQTGKLKDPRLQKMMDDWKAKTGSNADMNDDALVLAILTKELHILGPKAEENLVTKEGLQQRVIKTLENTGDRVQTLDENIENKDNRTPEQQMQDVKDVAKEDAALESFTAEWRNIKADKEAGRLDDEQELSRMKEMQKQYDASTIYSHEANNNVSSSSVREALYDNKTDELNLNQPVKTNPLAML